MLWSFDFFFGDSTCFWDDTVKVYICGGVDVWVRVFRQYFRFQRKNIPPWSKDMSRQMHCFGTKKTHSRKMTTISPLLFNSSSSCFPIHTPRKRQREKSDIFIFFCCFIISFLFLHWIIIASLLWFCFFFSLIETRVAHTNSHSLTLIHRMLSGITTFSIYINANFISPCILYSSMRSHTWW